jgi:hypothetical protein
VLLVTSRPSALLRSSGSFVLSSPTITLPISRCSSPASDRSSESRRKGTEEAVSIVLPLRAAIRVNVSRRLVAPVSWIARFGQWC